MSSIFSPIAFSNGVLMSQSCLPCWLASHGVWHQSVAKELI